MLVMGYLGDLLGREVAMFITMSFVAMGAIGSSMLSIGDHKYYIVAAFRFLVGVGSGGVYPLYAARAVESCGNVDYRTKTVTSAKGFVWGLPGQILAYALGLLLVVTQNNVSLQWRLLLGLGAVFPIFNAVESAGAQKKVNAEFQAAKGNQGNGIFATITHGGQWRNLLVTGGVWMLYDFIYYGTSLAQPEIVDKIWPDASEETAAEVSVLILSSAIPFVFLVLWVLRQYGTRVVQILGFILVAIFFALLSALYILDVNKYLLLLVYILLYSAFWFPNVSTYVLSAETYEPAVRGTLNGISAAMGKAGAVAGNVFFTLLLDVLGLPTILFIC